MLVTARKMNFAVPSKSKLCGEKTRLCAWMIKHTAALYSLLHQQHLCKVWLPALHSGTRAESSFVRLVPLSFRLCVAFAIPPNLLLDAFCDKQPPASNCQ